MEINEYMSENGYSWTDQVAFEHALANEWETIMQEAGFRNGSNLSSMMLYMRDEIGIELTPENFRFIQYIVRGD